MESKESCCGHNVRCFVKCIIFLILSLIGLYFVLPKYELMSPKFRFNKVTGKVESYPQPFGSEIQALPTERTER